MSGDESEKKKISESRRQHIDSFTKGLDERINEITHGCLNAANLIGAIPVVVTMSRAKRTDIGVFAEEGDGVLPLACACVVLTGRISDADIEGLSDYVKRLAQDVVPTGTVCHDRLKDGDLAKEGGAE